MERVLVTGGSGFVGAHVVARLLAAGYTVRTTVRSLSREAAVREMITRSGIETEHPDAQERLSFAAADLEKDAGWAEAVAGCDFVQHVASPFPLEDPKHEDELIVPAREGTLRVLRAARDARVRRVVITGSFAAIGYGHRQPSATPLDERTWTDPNGPGVTAYVKSKTLAERAAWHFIEREGGGLELVVVNPVGIFGPALGKDISGSVEIVQRLLSGAAPFCPRIGLGIVDVRDVAELQLLTMAAPEAAGERFLAVGGSNWWLRDASLALRRGLGDKAKKAPTREAPDWLIRLMALFVPALRGATPHLGVRHDASSEKARRMLGWSPRPDEEAIVATGRSLVELGVV